MRLVPTPLRHAYVKRKATISAEVLPEVRVRLATQPDELISAAGLLHQEYVRCGLSGPRASGVRVSPHLLSPKSLTFVASEAGNVIGTISIVLDSPLGLPVEKAFPNEVNALRQAGQALCEVGSLASDKAKRSKRLSYLLLKLMWNTAVRVEGAESLVISVREKVQPFYESLLFQREGDIGAYPGIDKRTRAIFMHQRARDLFGPRVSKDLRGLPSAACPSFIVWGDPEPEIEWPPNVTLSEQAKLEAAPLLLERDREFVDSLKTPERRLLRDAVPPIRAMLPSVAHA